MKPFTVMPLEEANDLRHPSGSARFLAGGTNLVDLMKHQIETPDTLIDLSCWKSANTICEDEDQFLIGAMVSNTALAKFAYQHPSLSLLAQALLSGATVQLRNRATTAGNLLQRTRCYQFYDTTKPCNKREPGSGCSAIGSFNRIHAILGTSPHCIASHPSDMATAMTALDASVNTITPDGQTRSIPVRQLYKLPGDTPQVETWLQENELIVNVSIPKHSAGTQIYKKVRDRSSYAFALVSVACDMQLKDGIITDIRLAFGSVGPHPWHALSTETFLKGKTATTALFEEAAEVALSPAQGFGGNDYKIPMLKRTLIHVLQQVADHQSAQPGHQGAIYAR